MVSVLKKISEDEFKQKIQNGLFLIDFYADWCGPCRMIAPHLEKLAEESPNDVTVYKFDIDAGSHIPSAYQVTSIPTLILFLNGKEVGRKIGLCNFEEIKSFVLNQKI